MAKRVTRGHGMLEGWLSRRRAARADRLLPRQLRQGRLLDIGCGSFPLMLGQIDFAHRYGVDKMIDADTVGPVDRTGGGEPILARFDVDTEDRLPFDDGFFQAVTMLAVFEHIKIDRLIVLLDEVYRVLAPGGVYVMTTPAGWTGPVLDLMKTLRLVSAEEIDEHEDSYSQKKIRHVIAQTRLQQCNKQFGYFELGMNVWGRLSKPEDRP